MAITLVPYSESLLEQLAQKVIDDHSETLPDLTQVTILLPELRAARALRRTLLDVAARNGHKALLGPTICRLDEWVNQVPLAEGHTTLDDQSRELLLINALHEYRHLFGEGNLWALADSLLELFDQLVLNQVELPATLDAFIELLRHGYGETNGVQPALTREATLVYTLWRAWQQQLQANGLTDARRAYLQRLSQLKSHPGEPIYLAGHIEFSRAELAWLHASLEAGTLQIFIQGEKGPLEEASHHPDAPIIALLQGMPVNSNETLNNNANDAFYRAVFPRNLPLSLSLLPRAEAFAEQYPDSPIEGRLATFHADSAEQEVNAITLQVRLWLLEGVERIAIVTENRRQARRLRALLERSTIPLDDSSGWAMSTTSAAAVVERWLECIEEDFPWSPLLDLLKSPFLILAEERQHHLLNVYRLEQDIIHHEGIGAELKRYRQSVRQRMKRLPKHLASALEGVITLLERLEAAALLIQPLRQGVHPPQHYCRALYACLVELGIDTRLKEDSAGQQLINQLMRMQELTPLEGITLNWLEFRTWLDRELERQTFRTIGAATQVQVMGSGQSILEQFDAVIIASAEREYLPGAPHTSPFFNDRVRQELGLPGQLQASNQRFYHFRRLLGAAPRILVTLRAQQDGEEILPCPWLENIITFHQVAYSRGCESTQLQSLLTDDSQVTDRQRPLPPTESRAAPSLPVTLIPKTFSASAYQQLIDCPYQFFAARILRLYPPDTIKEALEKSDYGEKVHRCLEAFHGGVAGLPGPFGEAITAANRDSATTLLLAIADREFEQEVRQNFLHRDWLDRWRALIPDYIAWQLGRDREWQVKYVEQHIQQRLPDSGITLNGRIDRIDHARQGDNESIIDYKTGSVPRQAAVESGESVQLPFYHLLRTAASIAQVAYLQLDGQLKHIEPIAPAALEILSSLQQQRLVAIVHAIENGTPLIANGDERSCGYCRMAGLCRHRVLSEG